MRDHVPSLEPRTGDYADMLRRARRRRTRRVALTATTAPALAAVLAFTAIAPHGTSSLNVADPPPLPLPAPIASLLPTTSPSPSPKPKPTASPTPTPTPTDDPTPGDGHGKPSDHPTPPGSPPGSPTPPPPSPTPVQPPTFAIVVGGAPAQCNTPNAGGPSSDTVGDAKHWCVTYPGAASFVAGETAPLPIRICRSTDLGVQAGTLTRKGDLWFKMAVNASNGGRGWGTYDRDVPAGAITVKPGDCAEWTLTWNASDYYGVPLDPGGYSITPVFSIEEYLVPFGTYKFPITVTT